jgi:hypothetical protein
MRLSPSLGAPLRTRGDLLVDTKLGEGERRFFWRCRCGTARRTLPLALTPSDTSLLPLNLPLRPLRLITFLPVALATLSRVLPLFCGANLAPLTGLRT